MKVLFLTKNMNSYKRAMYQRDLMEALAEKAEVDFYGPGFDNFDGNKRLVEAINFDKWAYDCVIVGHAWLKDGEGKGIDPFPALMLDECPVKKIVILNKEYTNLEGKLEWIRKMDFARGFSHHHDIDAYQSATNVPFTFIPFAVNEDKFLARGWDSKKYDFSFSGILQNMSEKSDQSDTRVRVMKEIFHCIGDLPVIKKRKYSGLRFFWNSIPRGEVQQKIARRIGAHTFLKDHDYVEMQGKSKAYLNTLSPYNLVSPRFFENMASKTLVICEESEHIDRIFPSDCYVGFDGTMHDFREKLNYYLGSKDEWDRIVDRAHYCVLNSHTWRKRADEIIKAIEDLERC